MELENEVNGIPLVRPGAVKKDDNADGWFDPKTTCHAVAYLPSGVTRTFAVAAYRVVSGVLQFIPLHGGTGEEMDTATLLLGTVEIRNAGGPTYNEHKFLELSQKLGKSLG